MGQEQKIYRVGGRDSRLEQSRSRQVLATLQSRAEAFAYINVPLDALDDTDLLLPHTLGSEARKKAEIKFLSRALTAEEIDLFAVNMTDLTDPLSKGLCLAAVLKRSDARDVLALRKGTSFAALDAADLILCRDTKDEKQLRLLRPDLNIKAYNESVAEVLEQVKTGQAAAAVVSAADLIVLGMDAYRDSLSLRPFSTTALVPQAGQGVVAVICREGDETLRALLARHLEDEFTRSCWSVESFCASRLSVTDAEGLIQAAAVNVSKENDDIFLLARNLNRIRQSGSIVRQRLNRSGESEPDETLVEVALQALMGRVSFIGCDASDIELLTKRAVHKIEQATRVFYTKELDLLAGQLRRSSGAEWILLRHGEDYASALILSAKLGHDSVRLLSGDPFFFSQGSSEMLEVRARSIGCELVPGVSSVLTWPAYAGVPLTHPKLASHVHVYDGQAFPIQESDPLVQELTRAKTNGTLVFVRAATRLPDIVAALKSAGFDESTAALLLTEGTSSRPSAIEAGLSGIAEQLVAANLLDPALLVVGDVLSLRKSLDWRLHAGVMRQMYFLELSTVKLADQPLELTKSLREAGAEVYAWQLAAEERRADLDDRIEEELLDLLERPRGQRRFERGNQWIAFAGPGAVLVFSDVLKKLRLDHRLFAGLYFAVNDAGTAQALEEFGFEADYRAPGGDVDEMAAHLAQILSPADAVLAIANGQAQSVLSVVLRLAEVPCQSLAYADSVRKKPDAATFLSQLAELSNIIFHDDGAVREFVEDLAEHGLDTNQLYAGGTCFFAASESAARACQHRNIELTAKPATYTAEAMLDCLKAKAERRAGDYNS